MGHRRRTPGPTRSGCANRGPVPALESGLMGDFICSSLFVPCVVCVRGALLAEGSGGAMIRRSKGTVSGRC